MRQKQFLISSILFISFSGPLFAAPKEVPPSLQRKYDYRQPEFEKIDCNEDKILQQSEIDAGIIAKFKDMDLDNDALLDQDEQDAAIAVYIDENTQFFGRAVEKRSRALRNRLRNADANKNKKISKQEYIDYMTTRYFNMDRNDDQEIPMSEFRTDTEKVSKR